MNIRILLVDDHQIVREGLRALLESEPGLEVVGEAADGRTALSLVPTLSPNVVGNGHRVAGAERDRGRGQGQFTSLADTQPQRRAGRRVQEVGAHTGVAKTRNSSGGSASKKKGA